MVVPGGKALLKQITALTARGDNDQALALLGQALRSGSLTTEETDRVGRLIAKLLKTRGLPSPLGVRLLGQFTTSWLATQLTAAAWADGTLVAVSEGEYDNVIQELLAPAPIPALQATVLLPWTQRLFHDAGRSTQQRIDDELAFWRRAWELASGQGCRIVQVGYDWVTPGAEGHHLAGRDGGAVSVIRRLNDVLVRELPPGSFFVDLEQVSGVVGRERFYDPRRYFWTKQPLSEGGAQVLARHVWAGLRALVTGPKKVLVLDLDNTLWGGVVGETGPLGIGIGESPDGEAYRAFQAEVKALAARGVVLAIASKNNHDDAVAPFRENPEMVLKLTDFAHVEATWAPKSESLQRIAKTLSLGLDSFVFFDDNPAEREQIRQALPQVAVADVPDDPAEYVRVLHAGLWFEAASLSAEDLARSGQYQRENQRRELQSSFANMDDYLTSLDMQGAIGAVDETTMQRVVQLLAKTNQFNVTTRRHTRADVERLLAPSNAVGCVLTLADRFGDHGLIAVVLAEPLAGADEPTLSVDTWLMSCRVIGRTAEEYMFNALVARALELGYRRLRGEFLATRKNAMVADLFDRLGFSRIDESTDGRVVYDYVLSGPNPARTFVRSLSLTANA